MYIRMYIFNTIKGVLMVWVRSLNRDVTNIPRG